MEKVRITIIGAGVIGLAVAWELSKTFKDLFVIEKNSSFGRETSSRNSEVIHAGIYYPTGSLKHKTCVEGNRLIYKFCSENKVGFKQTGKLIVSIDKSEAADLEELFRRGRANAVPGIKLLSKHEIEEMEPNIKAEGAIYSPSTGILDSHGFMKTIARISEGQGARIAYDTEVLGIEKAKGGYVVTTKDREGGFKFFTSVLINCAGLNSDEVAAMSGALDEKYALKYCKGDYFRVRPGKAKFINRLIYPVPKKGRAGLGIHATLDMGGGLRLGPDDEYIGREAIDYDVSASKREIFYESVRTFLPFIQPEDLSPDMAGIRPKLQGPGEEFRDFFISDGSEHGSGSFINLIGIESPGLTSSLSIAGMVKGCVLKNH